MLCPLRCGVHCVRQHSELLANEKMRMREKLYTDRLTSLTDEVNRATRERVRIQLCRADADRERLPGDALAASI
jgi:hypothetical protein